MGKTGGFDVVTGAFGYTGRFIAKRLLEMGREVRTITGHPDRPDPSGGRVRAYPFNFDDPPALIKALRGADTLYNTYWVRFGYGGASYRQAVRNTGALFDAAREAGVRRIVHISIANAKTSRLPYYEGKAGLEDRLASLGIPYAVIRPTVLFGHGDVLIGNIAWMLRRFPVFAVAGSGGYRIQPVFVEDAAELAVDAGQRDENIITDAAGPEVYTFDELVLAVRDAVGSRARLLHMPPALVLALSNILGKALGDIVLTGDELAGLAAGLLESHEPPKGGTRFSDWLADNAENLGRRYANELKRHFK